MAKKAKKKLPKPRHAWAINPKTRVKASAKKYSRAKIKRIEKKWEEDLFS